MYLLDADSMIDAKNRYYGFDIAPGYWDWIEQAHSRGLVHTVQAVRAEIEVGNDDLAVWMKNLPRQFGVSPTAQDGQAFVSLSTWAQAGHFKQSAANDFLNKGDYYLVGQSQSRGCIVVTNEVADPNSKRRVKIPDACAQLGVPCITPFEMLRRERVRLV